MAIEFHYKDVAFRLANESAIAGWLSQVVQAHKSTLGDINIIFCDDAALLQLNTAYLQHNTLTDIITFDYTEEGELSGDLFISIERATENAEIYTVTLGEELARLFVHGILHLVGYQDKTKEEKNAMTEKENEHLSQLSNKDVPRGTFHN